MFNGGPTEADMAFLGSAADDLDDADTAIELWPDTSDSVLAFCDMATQWRHGFAGATGLDYTALVAVLDLRAIAPGKRADVFDDVRLMEITTLDLMHAKADK